MTAAGRAAAEVARYLRAGVSAAGLRWQDTGYVAAAAGAITAPRGGITVDAGYLGTVLAALAGAGYLRRTVGVFCADCQNGTCPDHLEDREAAGRYDGLALRLRQEACQ